MINDQINVDRSINQRSFLSFLNHPSLIVVLDGKKMLMLKLNQGHTAVVYRDSRCRVISGLCWPKVLSGRVG